jgi:GT2 family glycosyltransferase
MLYLLTLTWNGADKLSKLKESIMPALKDLDYQWLIKDNASKDNTLEMCSEWKENIKTIPYKNNAQNFSEGMNFLFNEASPKDDDLIMLLNNDVVFNDQRSIHNMKKIIDKDDKVGVVGARLLFTNTNRLQHAGVVFCEKCNAPMHYRLNETTDALAEKNREFQVVTGAVLLTKAKYFKEVFIDNKSGIKGMDENFHWAFDDVDMCLAIKHKLDKKIVYCGKTEIFHEESASLKKNPTNKLFMNHNLSRLRQKWNYVAVLDKPGYDKDSNYKLYKE